MPGTVASVGEVCCFAMVSAGEGEAGGVLDEDSFCSLDGYIWFGKVQQQQFQDVEGEIEDDDIRLALARVMDVREAEERLSLFPESMLLPLVENGETKVSSLVIVLMMLDEEVGEPLCEAPRPTAAQQGYEKEDVVEVEEEEEEDDEEDMGRWEVTSTLLLERVSESRRPGRGDGAGEG